MGRLHKKVYCNTSYQYPIHLDSGLIPTSSWSSQCQFCQSFTTYEWRNRHRNQTRWIGYWYNLSPSDSASLKVQKGQLLSNPLNPTKHVFTMLRILENFDCENRYIFRSDHVSGWSGQSEFQVRPRAGVVIFWQYFVWKQQSSSLGVLFISRDSSRDYLWGSVRIQCNASSIRYEVYTRKSGAIFRFLTFDASRRPLFRSEPSWTTVCSKMNDNVQLSMTQTSYYYERDPDLSDSISSIGRPWSNP
jgi:hypothetical protein